VRYRDSPPELYSLAPHNPSDGKHMSKSALITGITGQDGSYLAEFLMSRGYVVHGIIRRASTFNTSRIDHIYQDPHMTNVKLFLHYGDLADAEQVSNLIDNVRPDEVYHLGAQTHVRISFDIPEYTGNVTALGATRILEAIRRTGDGAKIYQASSSEMFGDASPPQNEDTPFRPRSPYAAAKVYAYWMVRNYRLGYGTYACNGVMFNHESPRRGEVFVTRKITEGITKILANKAKKIYLGNLDAKRDWGYAPEYVECMWRILQRPSADDFVVGTGESHSVREFMEEAFSYVHLDWRDHVEIDARYLRPLEPTELIADSSKAQKLLDWKPRTRFTDLVRIMVDADMRKAGLKPIGEGDATISKNFKDRWWLVD
jgi:GDPmannose 4,6-dehydratase